MRQSTTQFCKHVISSLQDNRNATDRFSSIGIPGKGVTSDPVAIRIFFVEIEKLEPSAALTPTVLASSMLPHPLAYVTCQTECYGETTVYDMRFVCFVLLEEHLNALC